MDKSDNLLFLPGKIGQTIIEENAVFACPLLGTDKFVDFCKKRNLSIDRERLIRLERLGLFAPVFRVRTPKKNTLQFHIPICKGNNWFTKRWAWDTTGVPHNHAVPYHKDTTQEGYYSIFQIDDLSFTLKAMTLTLNLDCYLGSNKTKSIENWNKNGEYWIQYAKETQESILDHQFRPSLALLCQFISNIYYFMTQGDKRTIRVSPMGCSDNWIQTNPSDWDWDKAVENRDLCTVKRLFKLTPEKLRHAFNSLSRAQAFIDPIEEWHSLVQFVSIDKRKRLKGDALRSETIRAGANMLRFLHKDLYKEDLPLPNETVGTVILPIPELEAREDARQHLEFIVNDFNLNPQPKLSLIVEGQSEKEAVEKIFKEYFNTNVGTYGIEIIVFGGANVATGTKKDHFRPILRLIDYLHHHQTITFLIFDNENDVKKIMPQARKAKSIHHIYRHVTRLEYIKIWRKNFEFDNFSCREIADAMTKLAINYGYSFSSTEINNCSNLNKLYKNKTNYGLNKINLIKILIDDMLSPNSRRDIKNRPIIKTLEKVARLAARNPFPIRQEYWEKNQSSIYLGKKRKIVKKKT